MEKIFLFLMLMPFLAIGQKTVVQLQTQNNSQILLKGPSQLRSFKMYDSLIKSSVNLLGSYANPSWITSLPISKITSLGTGVQTALGVNIGSAGAPVLFNGAGGTPSSLIGTNITGIPPITGISGWPSNSSGVLTNNGSGTLTWGAAGNTYAADESTLHLASTTFSLKSSFYNTSPTASNLAEWDANKNLFANIFVPGFNTSVTAGGSTTLLVSSPSLQYRTGSANETITLPVVSTLPQQGTPYIISNVGNTGTLTINSSGGNTVQIMAAGSKAYLTSVLTTGTTAASWEVLYLPASPLNTIGDIFIGGSVVNGVATPTKLAAGATGTFIGGNGAGVAPTYQTVDANVLTGTTLFNTIVTSSLTSVGTLTGLSVSSTTANNISHAATWTATASAQSGSSFSGTLTTRNTNSDAIYGVSITPTLTVNAGNPTSQSLYGLYVNPSFTNLSANSAYAAYFGDRVQFTGNASRAAFNIGGNASDPTTNVGDVWFNTTGTVGTLSVKLNNSNFVIPVALSSSFANGQIFYGQASQSLIASGNNLTFTGSGGLFSQQTAQTSGAAKAFIVNALAHTGQTAAELTEYDLNAATVLTFTGSTGFATERTMRMRGRTYAFTSATGTITTASTLEISPPVEGSNAVITNRYALSLTGNLLLGLTQKIFVTEGSSGSVGQTTLVSGTKAVTVTGTTTSTRCFATLVSQGGTVTTTVAYGCVCTANTVTITALTAAAGTNSSDTSIINYWLIN